MPGLAPGILCLPPNPKISTLQNEKPETLRSGVIAEKR
jgi:hypothetical protein